VPWGRVVGRDGYGGLASGAVCRGDGGASWAEGGGADGPEDEGREKFRAENEIESYGAGNEGVAESWPSQAASRG